MTTSIHAFSIPLGIHGQKFSQEELEARKAAARNEIAILIPATKHLTYSNLKEYMGVENGKIFLSYELIESSQMHLDFDHEEGKKNKIPSTLVRLGQDLSRLKKSAEMTQIRVGELLERISGFTTASNAGPTNVFDDLDGDDLDLWKYLHKNHDKTKYIRFASHDVSIQIPLLPYYQAEPGTRLVRANVKSLTHMKASLANIKQISHIDPSGSATTLPSKLDLLRTEEDSSTWSLLYTCMEFNIPLEATLKVALHAHSMQPAYVELRSIENHEVLRLALAEIIAQ